MRRGRRGAVLLGACVVGCAVALAGRDARAQNTEGFFYSEDAALMAGAVTARPGDAASLWYDPAGLASLDRGRITASGSVFGIRVRPFPHAIDTVVGGGRYALDLDATDVIAVPNALTGSFRVADGVTIGAGLFATTRDIRKAADTLSERPLPDLPGGTVSERADLQSDVTKYHLGPGVGVALSRRVRVGAAVFVTYTTTAVSAQFAFGGTSPGLDAQSIQQLTVDSTAIGLTGSIGMQADIAKHVTVGLTARPPEVILAGTEDGGTVDASASTGPVPAAAIAFSAVGDARTEGTLAAPARLTAGALYRGVIVELEVDADLRTAMTNTPLEIALDPQIDLRAGVRVRASETLTAGFGAFTDRSAESKLGTGLAGEDVDYYGGTTGLTLRTPFALASAPTDPNGIVLTTTVAVRYAVGVGEIRGLVVGDVEGHPAIDVVYHDVMPFFGSSIAF